MEKNKVKSDSSGPGVVYLGHIPHGFYEDEMRKYFSQFGKVNKIKLSRSIKTGRSKGYAFIEFDSVTVAKVVADTMNNYLMFEKLLKCEFIPNSKVHPNTFIGCNKLPRVRKPYLRAREQHNSTKSLEKMQKNLASMKKRAKKNTAKLQAMGINYHCEAFLPDTLPAVAQCEEICPPGTFKMEEDSCLPETIKVEDEILDQQFNEHVMDSKDDESFHILYEDSSEDEISFTTPPRSRRSSILIKPKQEPGNDVDSVIITQSTPGPSRKRKSKGLLAEEPSIQTKLASPDSGKGETKKVLPKKRKSDASPGSNAPKTPPLKIGSMDKQKTPISHKKSQKGKHETLADTVTLRHTEDIKSEPEKTETPTRKTKSFLSEKKTLRQTEDFKSEPQKTETPTRKTPSRKCKK